MHTKYGNKWMIMIIMIITHAIALRLALRFSRVSRPMWKRLSAGRIPYNFGFWNNLVTGRLHVLWVVWVGEAKSWGAVSVVGRVSLGL